jgi:hypothetical protein
MQKKYQNLKYKNYIIRTIINYIFILYVILVKEVTPSDP